MAHTQTHPGDGSPPYKDESPALDIARDLAHCAARGIPCPLDLDLEYQRLSEKEQELVQGYLSCLIDAEAGRLSLPTPLRPLTAFRLKAETLVRLGSYALVRVGTFVVPASQTEAGHA